MIIPIPPKQTFGKFDTVYWENFLTDEDINFILSLPEWNNLETAGVGGSGNSGNAIDQKIRNGKIGWMTLNNDTKAVWHKLTEVISEVNSKFFHFDLRGCYEPAQLTLYQSDGKDHYNWHTDFATSDRSVPRKLSMSLLLSDTSDFEGGELQVKTIDDNPITLTQARGRALFFPSYTLHRVTPVTRGIRKSLVLWVGGPEFK
jgi:PKHD-type hydroxylase